MNNNTSQFVVICGMHRTGTSTITKSLETLGINLGNNLLEPMAGVNEKGFFEDRDFININEEILKRFNSSWHSLVCVPQKKLLSNEVKDLREQALKLTSSRIQLFPRYGIKDPRFSILLPFWQDIFNELNLKVWYILPCRDPISVALSLQKRDEFSFAKSFYLWQQHILSSIEYTTDQDLLVIDYNRVIDSPAGEIRRLADFLGVQDALDPQKLEEYQQSFLDRDLQHARFTEEQISSNEDLPSFVKELYSFLHSLANDELTLTEVVSNPIFIKLKDINQDLLPTKELFDSLEAKLGKSISKQNEYLKTLQEKQEQLTNLVTENNSLISNIKNLKDQVTRNENDIQILAEQRTKNQNEIIYLDSLLIKERESLKNLQEEVRKRDEFISFLDNLHTQKNNELIKLTASRSWKLTKPLRLLTEKIRSPQKKNSI